MNMQNKLYSVQLPKKFELSEEFELPGKRDSWPSVNPHL